MFVSGLTCSKALKNFRVVWYSSELRNIFPPIIGSLWIVWLYRAILFVVKLAGRFSTVLGTLVDCSWWIAAVFHVLEVGNGH